MKNLLLKFALFSTIAASFVFAGVQKTYAKEICSTQYGGGETCVNVEENSNIRVDKTVYNPSSDSYSDHIKANDGSNPYIFKKSEIVKFNIKVENTGKIKQINLSKKDFEVVEFYNLRVYNSKRNFNRERNRSKKLIMRSRWYNALQHQALRLQVNWIPFSLSILWVVFYPWPHHDRES